MEAFNKLLSHVGIHMIVGSVERVLIAMPWASPLPSGSRVEIYGLRSTLRWRSRSAAASGARAGGHVGGAPDVTGNPGRPMFDRPRMAQTSRSAAADDALGAAEAELTGAASPADAGNGAGAGASWGVADGQGDVLAMETSGLTALASLTFRLLRSVEVSLRDAHVAMERAAGRERDVDPPGDGAGGPGAEVDGARASEIPAEPAQCGSVEADAECGEEGGEEEREEEEEEEGEEWEDDEGDAEADADSPSTPASATAEQARVPPAVAAAPRLRLELHVRWLMMREAGLAPTPNGAEAAPPLATPDSRDGLSRVVSFRGVRVALVGGSAHDGPPASRDDTPCGISRPDGPHHDISSRDGPPHAGTARGAPDSVGAGSASRDLPCFIGQLGCDDDSEAGFVSLRLVRAGLIGDQARLPGANLEAGGVAVAQGGPCITADASLRSLELLLTPSQVREAFSILMPPGADQPCPAEVLQPGRASGMGGETAGTAQGAGGVGGPAAGSLDASMLRLARLVVMMQAEAETEAARTTHGPLSGQGGLGGPALGGHRASPGRSDSDSAAGDEGSSDGGRRLAAGTTVRWTLRVERTELALLLPPGRHAELGTAGHALVLSAARSAFDCSMRQVAAPSALPGEHAGPASVSWRVEAGQEHGWVEVSERMLSGMPSRWCAGGRCTDAAALGRASRRLPPAPALPRMACRPLDTLAPLASPGGAGGFSALLRQRLMQMGDDGEPLVLIGFASEDGGAGDSFGGAARPRGPVGRRAGLGSDGTGRAVAPKLKVRVSVGRAVDASGHQLGTGGETVLAEGGDGADGAVKAVDGASGSCASKRGSGDEMEACVVRECVVQVEMAQLCALLAQPSLLRASRLLDATAEAAASSEPGAETLPAVVETVSTASHGGSVLRTRLVARASAVWLAFPQGEQQQQHDAGQTTDNAAASPPLLLRLAAPQLAWAPGGHVLDLACDSAALWRLAVAEEPEEHGAAPGSPTNEPDAAAREAERLLVGAWLKRLGAMQVPSGRPVRTARPFPMVTLWSDRRAAKGGQCSLSIDLAQLGAASGGASGTPQHRPWLRGSVPHGALCMTRTDYVQMTAATAASDGDAASPGPRHSSRSTTSASAAAAPVSSMELTIADGSVFVVLPAAEGVGLSGPATGGSWWEASLSTASLRAVSAAERTYTLTARSFSVEASGPAADAPADADASRGADTSAATDGVPRPLSLLSTISDAAGRRSPAPAEREERSALEICVVVQAPELTANDCCGVSLGAASSAIRELPGGAGTGPTVSLMLEGVLYDNQLRGPPLERAVAQVASFLAPPQGGALPGGGAARQACAALAEPEPPPPPVLPWRLYVHVRDSLIQHTPSHSSAWGDTAPPACSTAAPHAWVLLTGLTLDARFGLPAAGPPHEAAAGATSLELMTHTAELFLGREAALRPALPVSAGPGATPLFVSVPPASIDAGVLGTGAGAAPGRARGAMGADGAAPLLLALRAQLHHSRAVRVASISRLVVGWLSCGGRASSETSISNDEVHLETAMDTTDALLRLAPDLGWNIAPPAAEGEARDADCPPLLPLAGGMDEPRAAVSPDGAQALEPAGGGWGALSPSKAAAAAARRSEPQQPASTRVLTPAPLVTSAGHHSLLSGGEGAAGQQAPWLDCGASWPPPSTVAVRCSEPSHGPGQTPRPLAVPPSAPRAAFFGGGLHIIDEYSGAHLAAANGAPPASTLPLPAAPPNDGSRSPSDGWGGPARKARHAPPAAAPRVALFLPAERDAFDILPAGLLGIEPQAYPTSLPMGVGGASAGPNRPPLEVLAAPTGATCAALAAATEFEEEMRGLSGPGAVPAGGGAHPVLVQSAPYSRSLAADGRAAVVPSLSAAASAPLTRGCPAPLPASLEPPPSAFGAAAPARGSARWLCDGKPPVIDEEYVPLWVPKASPSAELDVRGGVRRASQRLTLDEVNVRWTLRVGSGWDAGAGAAAGGGAGALGSGGERGDAPPCMELVGTALSCEYDIFETAAPSGVDHTGGRAAGGQACAEPPEWRVRVTLGRVELVDALDPHAHLAGCAPVRFLSPDDESPRPKEHTAFLALTLSQCDGETRLRARLQPVRLRVSHASLNFAMEFAQAAAVSAAAADQRAAAATASGRPPPLPAAAEPPRLVIELCDVRPLYLRIDFLVTLSSITSLYRTINTAQGPTTKQLIHLIPVSDVCLTLGRFPPSRPEPATAHWPARRPTTPGVQQLCPPVVLEPPRLSRSCGARGGAPAPARPSSSPLAHASPTLLSGRARSPRSALPASCPQAGCGCVASGPGRLSRRPCWPSGSRSCSRNSIGTWPASRHSAPWSMSPPASESSCWHPSGRRLSAASGTAAARSPPRCSRSRSVSRPACFRLASSCSSSSTRRSERRRSCTHRSGEP